MPIEHNGGAPRPLLANLVSFREDDQHFAQITAIAEALRVPTDRGHVVARIAFRVGLNILNLITEQWPLLLPPPPGLSQEQLELWDEFVAAVQQTSTPRKQK